MGIEPTWRLFRRHFGFEAQTTLDSTTLSNNDLRYVNDAVDLRIGNDIGLKSLSHGSEVECSLAEDQSLSLGRKLLVLPAIEVRERADLSCTMRWQ